MNKSKHLCALAAALLLTTCQMDIPDSIPLPPELPLGTIVQSADGGGYSFDLTWHRKPGKLARDAEFDSQTAIFEALEQCYAKWLDYTRIINPLPFFYKPDSTENDSESGVVMAPLNPFSFEVAEHINGGWKIKNNTPSVDGTIIIHRYWPKVIDAATGIPVAPNRITWLNTASARAAAFKKAAAGIEAMMAAIEKSPFYPKDPTDPMWMFIITDDTGEEVEVFNPLPALYTSMGDLISYNPPLEECEQRDGIDWVEEYGSIRRYAELREGRSGPLYEYYLGYAPWPQDYLIEAGPFALPEE